MNGPANHHPSDLVHRFFPGTGRSYDRVVRITTVGRDARWKRRVLARVPRAPRAVLDLACGTGILTYEILRRFPGARVVGVDITPDYLAVAREKHRRLGGEVLFLEGDAVEVPLEAHGPFDAVVSSYLPKYVNPRRLLSRVTPALARGGAIVLHDFTYPWGEIPRALWNLYFLALDPLARRTFPEWGRVFDTSHAGLIRRTTWVRDFREALHEYGYDRVLVERLDHGAATVVSARRA